MQVLLWRPTSANAVKRIGGTQRTCIPTLTWMRSGVSGQAKGRCEGLNQQGCGGMRRTVIQSVSPPMQLSRMTYEAQLLLQIQRHDARCGTFSRVKVLEEIAACLGGRWWPRGSARGLTRSHACNRKRTVISRQFADDLSHNMAGGAEALAGAFRINWRAAGQARLSRPGHCSTQAFPTPRIRRLQPLPLRSDS